MAVVLRSKVEFLKGLARLPAVLDLHDSGRVVVVRVNPRTGDFGEIVVDVPMPEISVTRVSTELRIVAAGKRSRVDFAGDSPIGLIGFGLIGLAVQNSYAKTAGIDNWVETFRHYGVLRPYRSWLRVLIALGIVVGVIVIFFALGSATDGFMTSPF
jgi:hypothetical protein